MKAAGVNGLRVFGAMTWSAGKNMQPDNPAYWPRVEDFLQEVSDVGGYTIQLVYEDNCSLDQPSQADRHWFLKKVGTLEAFWAPDSWPTLVQGERIEYMEKWVTLLRKYSIPFLLEIINEPKAGILPFIQWHHAQLVLFSDSKEHVMSGDSLLEQHHSYYPYAKIASPHGIYRPRQIFPPWPSVVVQKGLSVLYSADGLENQPASPVLRALAERILEDPFAIGYESKLNVEAGIGPYLDLSVIDYDKLKAFGEAYGTIPVPPQPPPTPISRGICDLTGLVPNHSCKVVVKAFLPGTEPTMVCPIHHDETFWEKLLRWLKGLFK